MPFTQFIYIDESGSGSPRATDINKIWVSVGISISFDNKQLLDAGIKKILRSNFRSYSIELKGSQIPHDLLPEKSIDDLVFDFHEVLCGIDANIWSVGTIGGKQPPPGFITQNPHAKEITRQLLLEQINGFLNAGYLEPEQFFLLWDISEVQELHDFSRNVASFINLYNGEGINPRLAPAILGGCSHDWSGLQAADLIAHLAFHKIGMILQLPHANIKKAALFDKYIYSLLQKNESGCIDNVGWKIW